MDNYFASKVCFKTPTGDEGVIYVFFFIGEANIPASTYCKGHYCLRTMQEENI